MNASLKRAYTRSGAAGSPAEDLIRPIMDISGDLSLQTMRERRDFLSISQGVAFDPGPSVPGPGSIDAEMISSVNASSITGTITAGQIGSVNAASISGTLSASQIGEVNANSIVGAISASQIGSVNASALQGFIQASQIGSVNASALSGTITASQIGSVNAGSITGTITSTQIQSISADKISGSIAASQIDTVNATDITGQIAAGQISSVNATAITGQITSGQIFSVSASSIAGTITSSQIGSVAASTITGSIQGTQIATISATQLTGSITAAQIGGVNASVIAGQIGASQISAVNANVITGTITSSQIGSVSAGTITGQIGSGQISSVTAGSITGSITGSQLAATAIDGFTITGSIIRSGTTGARWQGDTTGIRGYDAAGAVTFAFDNATGKITTLAGIGGPNRVPNSGFEDASSVTIWQQIGTFTSTTEQFKFGTKAAKLTIVGSTIAYAGSPLMPVNPGEVYTASFWYRAKTTWQTAYIYMRCYDAANGFIGDAAIHAVAAPADTWGRIVATGTIPAGTANVSILPLTAGVDGDQMYVDGVQFEEGSIVTAYGPKPDEILPNTVTGAQIASNAGITGGQISSVIASTVTGGLTASQITSVAASTITGTISSGQIGSVAATTITGAITASQIDTVNASDITGGIAASQITGVNASSIVGTITASQIGSVNAGSISGSISASQIGSVNASALSGTITASQIGSIHAATITVGGGGDGKMNGAYIQSGTINTDQLNATAIDSMTVTGALIRSSASGARVEMSAAGVRKFNSAGVATVQITPNDGLTLLSSNLTTPPEDQRIQFVNSSGAVSSEWYTYDLGGLVYQEFIARGSTAEGASAQAVFSTQRGDAKNYINMTLGAGGGNIGVQVMTPGVGYGFREVQLLSQDGSSGFVIAEDAAWRTSEDGTEYFVNPGYPAQLGPAVQATVTVKAGQYVQLAAYFEGASADANSNVQVQIRRNGALFLRSMSDYPDWLVNSFDWTSQGTFVSFAQTGVNSGVYAPRQIVPMIDNPGAGTYTYSMRVGATGIGGYIRFRWLAVRVG